MTSGATMLGPPGPQRALKAALVVHTRDHPDAPNTSMAASAATSQVRTAPLRPMPHRGPIDLMALLNEPDPGQAVLSMCVSWHVFHSIHTGWCMWLFARHALTRVVLILSRDTHGCLFVE